MIPRHYHSTDTRLCVDQSGISMLQVIMLLVLVSLLVVAGFKLVAPLVQRAKINETKTIITSDVDAIVSWTASNCRLPDAGNGATGFASVVTNSNDAWGNQLAYLYDQSLANATTCAQVCGISATNLTVSAGATNTSNVAFVIASSQYSGAFHNLLLAGTVFNGAAPYAANTAVSASGWVNGTLSQQYVDPPDILRVVTLNELKARIGCAGYTQGALKILNNELPKACSGSTAYSATLYGSGGAPAYTWSLVSPPAWVQINALSGALSFTAAPAATPLTVRLTDFSGVVVERAYNLQVITCAGSAPSGGGGDGGINNDVGDISSGSTTGSGFASNNGRIEFGLNQNNSSGCFWYPYNFPLPGKTLRAYWNFCYAGIDTSSTSSNLADGYTFSLMQGTNPTSYCGTGSTYNAVTNPRFDCSTMGGLGEYLAYCGLPGQSLALEFDIYPSSGRNDPTGSYNHLAIVKGITSHKSGAPVSTYPYGDNTHNQGGNPACNGTDPACLFGTVSGHNYPVTWLENDGCNADYSTHNARIEIHTRCNNDCSQCETNSCTTKNLIKVWVDRSWLGNCTGTCNGSTINGAKCVGTCTGTCDGATITNAQCIAPAWRGLCTGTCDGVSVTNAKCAGICNGTCGGTAITNASCMDKTWYLPCTGTCDGAPITNGRCLITTPGTGKCTGTCDGAAISNAVCNKSNLINLNSDEALTPDLTYCTALPTELNQYKVGFTQATGGAVQYGYIGDFMFKSSGSCPQATISPATLPTGTVGVPYTATLSVSGGTPPYSNWTWTAAAIPGVTSSNLPPGLTISTSGVISGTPTTAGIYNTILVSVNDACTADSCTNSVSKSYALTINTPPAPTCSLSVSPSIVAYNSTTGFTWSITNGPADGAWSTVPGGSCSNFSGSSGGSCTSGALTTPGATIYTLTVSNAGGNNSCSATTYVGCASYRVWNNTGARYDFKAPNGTCVRINSGSEITSSAQLAPGQSISRYATSNTTCGGTVQGTISYNQAMTVDIVPNGGDGDCQINYNSTDTAADR